MRLLLLLLAALPAAAADLDSLGFLTGCWSLSRDGLVIEESWSRPAAGTLLGYSRTLRGPRTVFHEFLRIELRDGALLYTPRIGNPVAPVSFTLLRQSPGEVVFENLAHDFPKRISYRQTPNGLAARIEGPGKDGQLRALDFPYTAVPCR